MSRAYHLPPAYYKLCQSLGTISAPLTSCRYPTLGVDAFVLNVDMNPRFFQPSHEVRLEAAVFPEQPHLHPAVWFQDPINLLVGPASPDAEAERPPAHHLVEEVVGVGYVLGGGAAVLLQRMGPDHATGAENILF